MRPADGGVTGRGLGVSLPSRDVCASALWGAPRLHGELLKLGISVSESDRDRRTADAMSALPYPEQTKTTTMPREHGRRLHDMERRAPATPSVRQPGPEHTAQRRQAKAWTAETRDDQLVPQRDDLQVEHRA